MEHPRRIEDKNKPKNRKPVRRNKYNLSLQKQAELIMYEIQK